MWDRTQALVFSFFLSSPGNCIRKLGVRLTGHSKLGEPHTSDGAAP